MAKTLTVMDTDLDMITLDAKKQYQKGPVAYTSAIISTENKFIDIN